ncbi:MAG: hypothetical protein ABR499_12955 [Gemmatimonadaceae bacterium]
MANPPRYPDSGDDTSSTPRWVKVFGIIALVVVVLFAILMSTGGPGGRHGPSRHMPAGDTGGQTTPPGSR